MTVMEQSIADGELLLNYALCNKIAVPDDVQGVLRTARARIDALEVAGTERDQFYAALAQLVTLVPVKVADIRPSGERTLRLTPLVVAAQKLMSYAAANAKAIDDEIRNGLIEVANAVAQGTPTVADEEKFFKNYQALTTKLAPVTAATLTASETRLPHLSELFRHPSQFKGAQFTAGRFVHSIMFVLVLLAAGFALAYQAIGETAMARYGELSKALTDLDAGILLQESVLQDKKDAATLAKQKSDTDAYQKAETALNEAQRELESKSALRDRYLKEQETLPDTLLEWERQPCGAWKTRWMCVLLEKSLKAPVPERTAPPEVVLFSAKAALTRMNQIILPLLLGLLGAYSWVLVP